jgi:AcrR family transcriptional regulator
MTSSSLAPQQERSRETVARLLKATIKMLEEHGLDGATIPRIAEEAGVAPASVYRRFEDRNALFRAAILDALEKSAAVARKRLRVESFEDKSLAGVVGGLVTLTMQQYRAQPGLMRALTRFVETDPDQHFRSSALAILSANFEQFIDMLGTFGDEIPHPNPRRAITFGLLTMATIIEVRALEQVSMWRELLPMSDRELHAEVTQNILAYLRSPGTPHRSADDPRPRDHHNRRRGRQ